MLFQKGKKKQNFFKIMELMHIMKKRLSYTVYSYIDRTFGLPLARVHPGFLLALCSKVVFSMLTMQILMRAKLLLFFFLSSFHVLKNNYRKVN